MIGLGVFSKKHVGFERIMLKRVYPMIPNVKIVPGGSEVKASVNVRSI